MSDLTQVIQDTAKSVVTDPANQGLISEGNRDKIKEAILAETWGRLDDPEGYFVELVNRVIEDTLEYTLDSTQV